MNYFFILFFYGFLSSILLVAQSHGISIDLFFIYIFLPQHDYFFMLITTFVHEIYDDKNRQNEKNEKW